MMNRWSLAVALSAAVLAVGWFLTTSKAQELSREALTARHRAAVRSVEGAADRYARTYLRSVAEDFLDLCEFYARDVESGNISREEATAAITRAMQSRSIGTSGGVCALNENRAVVIEPRADSVMANALDMPTFRLIPAGAQPGYGESEWWVSGEVVRRDVSWFVVPFDPWRWKIVVSAYKIDLARDMWVEALARELAQSTPEGGVAIISPGGLVYPESIRDSFASQHDWQGRPLASLTADEDEDQAEIDWVIEGSTVAMQALFDTLPASGWVVVSWASAETPAALLAAMRRTAMRLLMALAALGFVGGLIGAWRAHRREQFAAVDTERRIQQAVARDSADLRAHNDELIRSLAETREREAHLKKHNQELSVLYTQLEQSSNEIKVLNRMSDMLQACRNINEATGVVVQLTRELFPRDAGALYHYNDEQNLMEMATCWGGPLVRDSDFTLDDCWGLRRSKIYEVAPNDQSMLCQHVPERPENGYLCLPMMAQGELLGMIHLQWAPISEKLTDKAAEAQIEARRRLATNITEQFGLALANLKLREILRTQSIRDQLTGLYNRRHMEDALAREIHRAKRHQNPMGVIMLDVDHFKKFNDNFGHEEGDTLLRELGSLMQKNVRQEDIACRYGGEEFLVILPEAPLEVVAERAENLRHQVEQNLNLKQQSVTISVGVAIYPEHGLTGEGLVAAADQGLYQAKRQGRNRVVIWKGMGETPPDLPGT